MIADQVNYCPRCGTAVEPADRFGRMRPVCPNCSWIYFSDPKVAAAVLVEKGEHILLVRRANDPERGKWTLPAGFVDAGEDPARAAERECFEETGLIVAVTGLVDVLAGLEHPRGAHIVIFYRADVISGELQPGDDVDGADYFEIDHLPPLAFRSTAQILSRSNP
jgi:ADP-ribose pyrophosphatase YjhB (NUDIX family)